MEIIVLGLVFAICLGIVAIGAKKSRESDRDLTEFEKLIEKAKNKDHERT